MAEYSASPPNDPMDQPLDMPEESAPTPVHPSYPHKKRTIIFRLLKLFVILAILVLAGFIIWRLFFSEADEPEPTPNPSAQQVQQEPETDNTDYPATEDLTEYDNPRLRITLSHPENWTVTEDTGGFRIESPDFTYQALSGETEGNFRVYIRQGAREQDSEYIGRGVAIKPSEKLTYAKPTTSQREDTNLSHFGYDDTSSFAYFMIAGNFTLDKGDTLGPDYAKETDAYVIAGGFSGPENKDDLMFNEMPGEGYDSYRAYEDAIKILESLELR